MAIRHRDAISAPIVMRAHATDGDACAARGDELLGTFARRDGIGVLVDLGHGETIDLRDIEDARCAGDEATVVLQAGDVIALGPTRQVIRVASMPHLLVADAVPYFTVDPWRTQVRDVRDLHKGLAHG